MNRPENAVKAEALREAATEIEATLTGLRDEATNDAARLILDQLREAAHDLDGDAS